MIQKEGSWTWVWCHILLFSSCASSPCYTWDIASITALCSCGAEVHTVGLFAASPLDQTHLPHLLPPHWLSPLSALNQSPAAVPPPGLLTRVHRPPPPTAAWVAVTTVCGSNTRSSCWRITTMAGTGRSVLSRKTSWTRTSKRTWRWRSGWWKRRDWCVLLPVTTFHRVLALYNTLQLLTLPPHVHLLLLQVIHSLSVQHLRKWREATRSAGGKIR